MHIFVYSFVFNLWKLVTAESAQTLTASDRGPYPVRAPPAQISREGHDQAEDFEGFGVEGLVVFRGMGKGKALWNSRTLRLGKGIWDLGLKGHHIKVENFEGFGI